MAALDIELIWYGVLSMVNLELATITPPVGMNRLVIKGTTTQPPSEVISGAFPSIILMLIGLFVLLTFPGLATWLPYTAGFGR